MTVKPLFKINIKAKRTILENFAFSYDVDTNHPEGIIDNNHPVIKSFRSYHEALKDYFVGIEDNFMHMIWQNELYEEKGKEEIQSAIIYQRCNPHGKEVAIKIPKFTSEDVID